jgi:hypothetical protein
LVSCSGEPSGWNKNPRLSALFLRIEDIGPLAEHESRSRRSPRDSTAATNWRLLMNHSGY